MKGRGYESKDKRERKDTGSPIRSGMTEGGGAKDKDTGFPIKDVGNDRKGKGKTKGEDKNNDTGSPRSRG